MIFALLALVPLIDRSEIANDPGPNFTLRFTGRTGLYFTGEVAM